MQPLHKKIEGIIQHLYLVLPVDKFLEDDISLKTTFNKLFESQGIKRYDEEDEKNKTSNQISSVLMKQRNKIRR